MTIVCGTDFSAPSTSAVRVAAMIAARLGEPLLLVHVLDAPGGALLESEHKALTSFLRLQLRHAASRARELGAEVEDELAFGHAADVLRRRAEERNATLIVLSAVGRRPPARWLLGSVAERVVRTANRPVIVVRDAGSLEQWLRKERTLEVIVGLDRTEGAEAALSWAFGLRRIGPCNVTLAHLAWPLAEHDRLGIGVPTARELDPEIERALTTELEAKTRDLTGDGNVRVVVRAAAKRIDEELTAIATERTYDLVIVGAHRRSRVELLWHDSVSRGVLHLAPMNVATVPAELRPLAERPIPVIERVLVGTDFSEVGNRGVAYAFSLLPNGGTVHLVHVISPAMAQSPITEMTATRRMSPDAWSREVKAANEQLERLVPEAARTHGVRAELEVLEGYVADELCRAAERLDVDVVCMGSHGRSGFSAAMFGSVARKVLGQSRRPVLVVGPKDR